MSLKIKMEKFIFIQKKLVYEDEFGSWYSYPDMINITGQFPEFDNMSYKDELIKVEINIKRI